jgi:hypothetical protein
MNPGVITGVFSCAEVRNERLDVRGYNKETRTKRQESRLGKSGRRDTTGQRERKKTQDIPPN